MIRRVPHWRSAGVLALVAFVAAVAISAAVVGLPAAAVVRRAVAIGGADTAAGIEHPVLSLGASIAWAFGASLAGIAIAWPASRALRRGPAARGDGAATLAVLLPLALPPWLIYAALWMCCGPGTRVGDLCERTDSVGILRTAILTVALAVWSAACAFAVLAGTAPRGVSRDEHLLALDGAGAFARWRAALARDGRSLLLACVASAMFLLCETTVFDLAQVSTMGFELRTLDALGAPPSVVIRAGLPSLALGVLAALALPLAARALGDVSLRSRSAAATRHGSGAVPIGRLPRPALLVAAIPTVALVILLCAVGASIPRAGDFALLHGRALAASIGVALAVAAIIGLLAATLRILLDARHSAGAPAFARVLALSALALGLAPATITALSIQSAYNTTSLGFIYDSPMAVVLALCARTAPIAAIAALALAAREPATAWRLRALDGVSLTAAWRGLRGEVSVAAMGAAALAFAWSLGELTASGRVVPPGMPWIATDILNAIHYQRPDTVVLAAGAIVVAALPAVWGLMRLIRRVQPGGVAALALAASLVAMLPGCGEAGGAPSEPDDRLMAALRESSPEVGQPLAVQAEFAGVGRGQGQFNGPRVLAIDRSDGAAYVIDKDARVQCFAADGTVRAEWRMPKWDRGKPTGASIAPDGSLVVADTHEHRIVCFSPKGEILWTLGEYGKDPGQFIYPTDIAFLPDGRMLISEYGGNDRIQAFGADRRFMYQFGRCGTEPGEFLRPQSLAYDAARDELYVADAGNHRIQVFTADGELRRALGRPGQGAGELNYPFSVVLLVDGRAVDGHGAVDGVAASGRRTVLVAEHSNHRLQELDGTTGESLAIVGGIGRERGRLKYPWAIDPAGLAADGTQRFAVCDHGNSRIVFFDFPGRH